MIKNSKRKKNKEIEIKIVLYAASMINQNYYEVLEKILFWQY